MNKEIVEGFLEEADELFENFTNLCLKAEEEGDLNDDDINALFRDVHTLKGSGSVVGFKLFPKYVHDLETFMDKLRKKELSYEHEMSDLLLESGDVMRELLSLESSEELEEENFITLTNETSQRVNLYLNSISGEEDSSEEDADAEILRLIAENAEKARNENSIPKPIEKKIEQNSKPILTKSDKAAVINTSIRVNLDKVDKLMNQVGNLVITNSMLIELNEVIEDNVLKKKFEEKLQLLDREIRSLQDAVMNVRMVPMETIYSKFPKMIRDVSKKLDKKINFSHTGDTVEIDKSTIEGLIDPLMHIIRNSLDHGIESKKERILNGKEEVGNISISAEASNGLIVITIVDDGGGINLDKVTEKALSNNIITQTQMDNMTNDDKAMLIFAAGLSTADEVSDISGRGVGMDVVKNNIEKLGGKIKISTAKNNGTNIEISLPLTLAILDGLNIKVGKEIFIIPLNLIIQTLQPEKDMIKVVGSGNNPMFKLTENELIPIMKLSEVLNIPSDVEDFTEGILLVIGGGSHKKVALLVDDFLNKQQFVVKPLEKNFAKIGGFSGATIKGNGTVSLIIDPFTFKEYLELEKNNKVEEYE
jgi:two-component system chemotaxis sensor kinase CheA